MNNLSKLSVLLLLLFTLSFTVEITAQIHEIKKKSSSNKSKRSNSSSSKKSSSKKKKSSGNYYSSSSSESDVSASDVFGCLSTLFDAAGCLIDALGNSESNTEYSYNTYDYEQEIHTYENNVEEDNASTDILMIRQTDSLINVSKVEVSQHNDSIKNEFTIKNDTLDKKPNITIDIRALFDLCLHKGVDKNYVHVNYLPGVRANFDFFQIDFRFNVLTEYTDDFPDSFKSLELLMLFDLTARQNHSILIGAGFQHEEFNDGTTFPEFYFGTKVPLKNNRDHLDIDTRFSKDFKTDAFPFFELGGRYNVRFLNEKKVSGYISLGASYQNYYQSYDIWGFRSGLLINIH